MSGILDVLTQSIGQDSIKDLSRKIGANEDGTQKAIAAALPVLIGGLARNANASSSGAESLASALDKDHDGSLLDSLGGLLGGGSGLGGLLDLAGGLLGGEASKTTDGDGILGHVLGQRRSSVEHGVAKASGLDVRQIAKLLPLLAPIVMGALGKVKREKNLDASGLAGMLGQERAEIEKKTPGMKEGGLASFLDFDGDGDLSDDVAKIGTALAGSGMLGKIFGR